MHMRFVLSCFVLKLHSFLSMKNENIEFIIKSLGIVEDSWDRESESVVLESSHMAFF